MQRIAIDMDEVMADTMARYLSLYNADFNLDLTPTYFHGRRIFDAIPEEHHQRAFSYFERVLPEEHAIVRGVLERAVDEAAAKAAAWAMLSMVYGEEHRFGFNARPDCLDRALRAASWRERLARGPTYRRG